jgi:type VI protein secretion system component VasK
MLDKLVRVGLLIVATLGIWMAVAMMDVVTGSSHLTNFAAIIAFLSTIALWLVWGLSNLESRQQASKEKTKRKPAEDARLALLLELMDEDDRQALKQRLMDEIGGDGEVIPLAELLETEEKRSGQRRTG